MSIDPTRDDVRRLIAEDDGAPIVMLNLLRFAGEEGRASYGRYAQTMGPALEKVGARVVYAGDCSTKLVGPDSHEWDAVLLVRYPTRGAFLDMVQDPDYQAINHLRSAGLDAAVLEATSAWSA